MGEVIFMYLSSLSKEQKELFLDLVIFSMSSDGVVEDREEEIAKRYCNEMQMQYRTTLNLTSHVDVLQRLKNISEESDLKKMTVELVSLMYADEKFADKEDELLRCVQTTFGFDSHLMGEIVFCSRHLLLSLQMLENVTR